MPLARVAAVLLACAACLPDAPDAARVLSVFPVPMPSHWIVGRALLQELHARGHDVTVVTPYPCGERRDNWTDLLVPNTMHLLGGTSDLFNLGEGSAFLWLLRLFNYGISSCEVFFQEDSVKSLFQSGREFDVIIIETFFNDCFMALSHRFKAPVVAMSTLVGMVWMSDMMGNPSPLSYVPEPFLRYTDHMSFWERLHNAAFATFSRAVRRLYYMPAQDAMLRRRLEDPTIPSLLALERNTSLLFVNSHPSMHFPRPLVPNVVEIGGMHVSTPRALPQDLQEFLDNAEHGAILFSLGSNIKCTQLPEGKRAAFVEAFSKLKQRVLWKWEAETLPGKPDNLMLAKWLPQSDVLAHKNMKLFITHGGLGSTLEAVHRGVPLIGIPVFADQNMNMNNAVQTGYAIKLQFRNITVESLLWAITESLDNPRYRERARQLSRLFNDRPRPALEEAVFWTEYVVRHKGAPHLRSAARDLAWYQLCLLDVQAAVLAGAAAGVALLVVAARGLRRISATHIQ